MKSSILSVVGLSLLVTPLHAADSARLKDQKDKVSYSIGVNIGTSFKRSGADLNLDVFLAGVKDALAGDKTILTEAEMEETMKTFQMELANKQMERAKEQAAKNKKDGDAFLTENKAKAGVKTTASGLQYKVLKEGSGKKPAANDTVRVHYKGTLIDGTEFDSSYTRNMPEEFSVSELIPGWTEALQLMSVGSKWQLVVPPDLAYRDRGPDPIGPNATLVFDMELLGIVSQSKTDK